MKAATLLLIMLLAASSAVHAGDKVLKTPEQFKKDFRSLYSDLAQKQQMALADTAVMNRLTLDALKLYPSNSIAHELRGRLFLLVASYDDNGHKREHRDSHGKLVETKPSSRNLHDLRQARFHFIKALDYDNTNLNARNSMLTVETQLGEYSSALIYCNELLEESPYDSALWKKKISLYRLQGNEIEADRLAQRYITIYSDDVRFRQGLAEYKDTTVRKAKPDEAGYALSQREDVLRNMIALNPKVPAYYYYLVSHLSSKGRPEEALDVLGTAIYMCKDSSADDVVYEESHPQYGLFVRNDTTYLHVDHDWFIHKRVTMLCDLNRSKEAENFLLNLKAEGQDYSSLLSDVYLETARAARTNDPYEAYARLYGSGKSQSQEALDYLTNTALKRGYLQDALGYIHDQQNRNSGPKWLLAEYDVLKSLGYTSKANEMQARLLRELPQDSTRYAPLCDFMQQRMQEAKQQIAEGNYRHAALTVHQVLDQNITNVTPRPDDHTFSEYHEAAWSNLYTCYLNSKQYPQALSALDTLYTYYRPGQDLDRLMHRVDVYCAWGRQHEALDALFTHMTNHPSEKKNLSPAYEEIALPYIKSLIDDKRLLLAYRMVEKALTVSPAHTDLLTYGINTAQTLCGHRQLPESDLRSRVTSAYKAHSTNRFFVLKMAQLQQRDSLYQVAMNTAQPLFDTYTGDSTLIGLYAENAYLYVDSLLKRNKQNRMGSNECKALLDSIRRVTDKAAVFTPEHPQLMLACGRYYEAMAKYDFRKTLLYRDSAYQCYRLCKGEFDSPSDYRRVTNQLFNDSRHNELSFEYQHGISGEEPVRSGTAYATYKRIMNRGSELFCGIAYAGRSGLSADSLTDFTKGGIGYQLSLGYSHNFSRKFNAEAYVAYANRYFPDLTAKLGATWHMKAQWDLNLHAAYRHLETYSGEYFFNELTEQMELDHWNKHNSTLLQFGTTLSKMLGTQFRLSAGVDGFMMKGDFFYNGNIKCQYYPVEGSKSHFFVSGGAGTAPDGTMIDRAHSVAFKDVNGFASMGGFILLTRNIGLSLSGTWNTVYVQNERPSTTLKPLITNAYKNYFYANASVVIKF